MNLQRSIRVVGALVLLFSFTIATDAQRRNRDDDRDRGGRWEYLGQSHVDGRSDHDNIRVNARGGFRAIQLQVQGGAIEFNRVVVHFENGADHQVDVRERIRAGGRTRAIDLPGDRRGIRSVEFWYEKENWRRRPTLRLYGRR
ncbi:MAG: hypothetical protein AABO57_15380 [Acidobacteriota bacterium]